MQVNCHMIVLNVAGRVQKPNKIVSITSELQIFHSESCDIRVMFELVFHDSNFFFEKLLEKTEEEKWILSFKKSNVFGNS